MKQSKRMTKKHKAEMFKGVYDPTCASKFALKKKRQARGNYADASPFRAIEEETTP